MTRCAFILGLLGACGGSAPAEPTWVADVEPILSANCVRCHSLPSGAPTGFRLDVYDDTTVGTRTIRGARSMAEFSAARVDMGGHPPVGPTLDGRQKDILRNWVPNRTLGAHADNHPPAAMLLGTLDAASFTFIVADADDDPVIGSVRFGPGDGDVIPGEIHEGRNAMGWDTSTVPPGEYTLSAVMSDGLADETQALGTVTVAHPGGTAPSVAFDTFLQPLGDDVLIADRDSPFDIQLSVSDPDGGMLALTLTAFRGDNPTQPIEEVPIVTRTIATDAEGKAAVAIPWNSAGVTEAATWRLHAVVTDAQSNRTDVTSPPIIVSHGTTTDTYGSVSSILGDVCGQCHNGMADSKVAGTDFTTSAGIRALRGRAWRKVAQQREMPPKTLPQVIAGAVDLTEEQRTQLGAWLYAGAPP
jgi:hypothetical protein